MPPGRLGVPTWDQQPQLSEAQIQAIVAYASSFGEGPQIPQVVAELGDIQRGWRLYINNCAACHGATGGGGGIGGGVIAPPLHAADPLIVAEAMVVGPGPMPRFIFPDDDVNAIAAYVEFLRAEAAPGGIDLAGGPVPEGAIAALLGVGLLVLIVRWIARRAEFEPAPEQENRQ
jgi:ubiquinol-cytochrome c reductase cytochrome c subunit